VRELEVASDAVAAYTSACAEAAGQRAFQASQAAFLAGVRTLFETHKELDSFGWRQYTSYCSCGSVFSDGVDCSAPDINGIEGHHVEGWDGWDDESGKWTLDNEPSPAVKLQHAVAGFLNTLRDDDLLDLLGFNTRVTIHRDGRVETEYCDDESSDDGDE